MGKPDIKVIPKYIEKSIVDTFQIQLKSQAKVVSLTMDPGLVSTKRKAYDCLSTLTMHSTSLIGQLSIALPKPTFINILERMIGERVEEVTSENSDACGEILNIVFSSSRRNINETGFDFHLAIPSTIIGQNLTLAKANLSGYALFFECQSDLGDFLVMLSLRQAPVASAA